MAKLSTDQQAQLSSIGITGLKTVDEGRTAMIEYLAKHDIEGVDDDPFNELFDMAEVMYNGSDDELDKAVEEKKTPKADKKKSTKKPEPEPEDEDEDEEEDEPEDEEDEDEDDGVSIDDMRAALVKSGKKEREVKKMKDKAVLEAYNLLIETSAEEDEDDDDEEEVPVAKKTKEKAKGKADETPAKKPAKKPAASDDDEEEEEAPAAKAPKAKANTTPAAGAAAKKTKEKKEVKETKKIDPFHNPEDKALFQPYIDDITKILSKHEVQFDFLIKAGIVVRLVGDNSKRVIFCFNSFKYNAAGEPVGKFYFPTVRGEAGRELLEEIFGDDIDIFEDWSGKLKIKEMPLSAVPKALKVAANKAHVEDIIAKMNKKDEKLGKNREKMEADLKDDKKTKVEAIKGKAAAETTKTKAKSKSTPVEDDEDEEEETAPVAPAKAKKKKK